MRHKEAPNLITERLILRAYRRKDFDGIYTMSADPEITAYMGGPTLCRSKAWEKFLRGPAMWNLLGYGMWVVERRNDGTLLGQIGYADFMRDMDPPLGDMPEMAWMLNHESRSNDGRGMGYGSEALNAVLSWGDENLDFPKYQCIISPTNISSIKLAQKFGFSEIRRSEYNDDMVIVFERTK